MQSLTVSEVVALVRLSTLEFHEAVHALSPTVAVFDCDGTLWSGDAGSGFMKWTIETGLVSREATDWIDTRYRAYLRREVSEVAICGEMVQMYQRLREDEMRRAAKTFFATQIEPNIFPEMKQLVDDLRARNVDIWAVSSTNNWVIEEGVQRFGIAPDRVLAARVAVKDGVVTDTVLDVPTDEGKVAALRLAGVAAPDAVFGNSVHDAAMLAMARRAFPVNPTVQLLERSAAEGWPVFYPASVRPA
ncbi:MAG: haloacid dehalogenase-like hydrolase [Acidobacteriota bacterium]|nr:haloacid dehalogenase-like hydrolase [Acidobacteriota bacterium]